MALARRKRPRSIALYCIVPENPTVRNPRQIDRFARSHEEYGKRETASCANSETPEPCVSKKDLKDFTVTFCVLKEGTLTGSFQDPPSRKLLVAVGIAMHAF